MNETQPINSSEESPYTGKPASTEEPPHTNEPPIQQDELLVAHTPRVGTALWGLLLTLVGLAVIAMGLNIAVNMTWAVAGGLALLGLVFLAFSLRSPRRG